MQRLTELKKSRRSRSWKGCVPEWFFGIQIAGMMDSGIIRALPYNKPALTIYYPGITLLKIQISAGKRG